MQVIWLVLYGCESWCGTSRARQADGVGEEGSEKDVLGLTAW